jgi:hypothetical protein
MKCIDAIEGTVKNILQRIHAVCIEDNLDDTEYVRNIKAVIDGVDLFIRENPEIVDDPQLLNQVLYLHSRNLWLVHQQAGNPDAGAKPMETTTEKEEYQTYYFDYLYHRGMYPR